MSGVSQGGREGDARGQVAGMDGAVTVGGGGGRECRSPELRRGLVFPGLRCHPLSRYR